MPKGGGRSSSPSPKKTHSTQQKPHSKAKKAHSTQQPHPKAKTQFTKQHHEERRAHHVKEFNHHAQQAHEKAANAHAATKDGRHKEAEKLHKEAQKHHAQASVHGVRVLTHHLNIKQMEAKAQMEHLHKNGNKGVVPREPQAAAEDEPDRDDIDEDDARAVHLLSKLKDAKGEEERRGLFVAYARGQVHHAIASFRDADLRKRAPYMDAFLTKECDRLDAQNASTTKPRGRWMSR
jgi:hypothetical protein